MSDNFSAVDLNHTRIENRKNFFACSFVFLGWWYMAEMSASGSIDKDDQLNFNYYTLNHIQYLRTAFKFYIVGAALSSIGNHLKIRAKDDGAIKLKIYYFMRLMLLISLLPFCYYCAISWFLETVQLNTLNWWQTKDERFYGNNSFFCALTVWLFWAYSWFFVLCFTLIAVCTGFLFVMLILSCGKVRNLFDLLIPFAKFLNTEEL